jgi:hypothetical protein
MTIGVTLFWPANREEKHQWWTRAIPLWNRRDTTIAKWQSILLLGVVNALFFAVNTIDVVYLWGSHSLPSGVNPSGFVHEGVQSLITAVILAAVILAFVFQQQPSVARTHPLRILALAWIVQNILLIFGVLKRLELYVEAYQLSELRVYVACFLALVTTGFLLLARHVWTGMRLGKLLFENMIATFALFFVLQFCDVGAWVAKWNVSRWQNQRNASIDLDYIVSLGSRGWPALGELARSTRDHEIATQAAALLQQKAIELRGNAITRDWRSFQVRRDSRAQAIIRDWAPKT